MNTKTKTEAKLIEFYAAQRDIALCAAMEVVEEQGACYYAADGDLMCTRDECAFCEMQDALRYIDRPGYLKKAVDEVSVLLDRISIVARLSDSKRAEEISGALKKTAERLWPQ